MYVDNSLDILTGFTIVIIIGIFLSLFAKKIKISNVLVLLLAGLLVGSLDYFEIDPMVVVTIATLALIVIIFDGSSKVSLKTLSEQSVDALKLIFLFMILSALIITPLVTYLMFEFNTANLVYGLVVSLIVLSTDPASTFIMLKNKTNKVIEFLEAEALLNTPIIVILPFIVIEFFQGSSSYQIFLTNFLSQILIGIGAGILVGVLFYKGVRKFYSEQISPMILIGSALLTYVLAENLNGNGILAVAVLGFVFGYFYFSHKDALITFSSMFSGVLEILVFMLIGFIIQINLSLTLFLKAALVFAVLILVRFLATSFLKFNTKEKLYISLNMPKGIAVAVLVFSLSFLTNLEGIAQINELIIIIMIYSLIVSSLINKYSQKFIRVKLD